MRVHAHHHRRVFRPGTAFVIALLGSALLWAGAVPGAGAKGPVNFELCGELGCVERTSPRFGAAMLYGGRRHPGPGCRTPVHTVTASFPGSREATRQYLLIGGRGLRGQPGKRGYVWWTRVKGARKGTLGKATSGTGPGFRAPSETDPPDPLIGELTEGFGRERWRFHEGLITCSRVTRKPDDTMPAPPMDEGSASCQEAIIGQGHKDWRRRHIVAGRVAVNRRPPPLSFMSPSSGGTMVTKMMLMVIGRQPVRVSIPDGSDRAWLYYGRKASAFAGSTSYRSVVLHPCRNKKRTVFPGGIRVKGGQPVRLLVSPLGKDAARVLPLGRPKTLADGR